jgi:RimJ/RimL family protein N-acetyltransferase
MKVKNIIYINNGSIYLRPFLKKDITTNYLSWINNYHKNSFIEAGKFPVSELDLKKYYKENLESKKSVFFAVCNKKGLHIGNALINNIDWVNRRCSYGRLIGNKSSAPTGAGTIVLKLLQFYAFNILNLNLMWTTVCENNYGSIKSNIKAGMNINGNIKKFFYHNNKYYNASIFSITREEFQRNLKSENFNHK